MTPSMPESISPFERLLVELVGAGVDFAVVGGVAVSLNGFVRATDDLDIIVRETPENVGRMLACLAGWGEGWARELKAEEFAPQEGSIRVMEDFDLDIFTRMQGKALDDFRPRHRPCQPGHVPTHWRASRVGEKPSNQNRTDHERYGNPRTERQALPLAGDHR
jgi:hypothetical protein